MDEIYINIDIYISIYNKDRVYNNKDYIFTVYLNI